MILYKLFSKIFSVNVQVDKKGKVVPELKIHELRAETYNGMVRLLKPGDNLFVVADAPGK
jgi:hypothetical protein